VGRLRGHGGVRGVLVMGAIWVAAVLPDAAMAQPAAYSAEPIRGRVVDAETRQPLEGVHVVAQWILQTGILHGRTVERLHILETVTDATGAYRLPGWGPKPRPALSRLETSDPLLTFFKPGYRPLDRSNNEMHDRPVRTSRWDGKTIALEPFRGSPEEWVSALQHVQFRLDWAEPRDDASGRPNDYWRHFPRMVIALLEERRALPDRLRHRVQDLRNWGVDERDLRALAKGKGDPK
jgi:hypothetical protein